MPLWACTALPPVPTSLLIRGFRFLLIALFVTASVHFHLVLLVRYAPEITRRRRYHLVILHSDLEVLHLELPCEEHAVVGLAFGLQFVPVRLRLTVIPRVPWRVLWLFVVVYRASKTAGDAILATFKIRELTLHGFVELLKYIKLLFFTETHLIHGFLQGYAQWRL